MIGLQLLSASLLLTSSHRPSSFEGRYVSGIGQPNFLQALDNSYAMLQPSPSMACLPMLYNRDWNGFVEGPTWNAWWIQNSFGPSYTMMPFLQEPYRTWLTNSQNMWFAMMGDGKHKDFGGMVGPVGCLCDAATPDGCWYRQGDGNVAIHDWCIGFTTAGLLLQSELMLEKRDPKEIAANLPKLQKVAEFLDARRDRKNNLIMGGVASNLLAPSYGGWLQADGSREKAYLAELSVNYVAALDRLIEVCKLAHRNDLSATYQMRRNLVKKALPLLMTPEGYFVQANLPDGTRQGVYGAAKSGFFETAPNHDAMCFRVVDDHQAKTIYQKIKSIPELRPNDLILPNYPSYDNMYDNNGLFTYGVWVNGGHWTTAEARMLMGYYRVGAQADALASFNRIYKLALGFRADNNLTDRGAQLYQPGQAYNVVYDCWGAPGGMLRGLFEYQYQADGLRLYPHFPTGLDLVSQKFPVMFGEREVYISAAGSGPIRQVIVDGHPVTPTGNDSTLIQLNPSKGRSLVQILMGHAIPFKQVIGQPKPLSISKDPSFWHTREFDPPASGNMNPICIGMSTSKNIGFYGQMKDVRIYRVDRTAEQIGRDATIDTPVSNDHLLAYFPLQSGSGPIIKGGPQQELAAKYDGPHPIQVSEDGMKLEGESGLVLRPSALLDLQDNYTLEAWIKPTQLPGGGSRLIDHCTVGASDGFNFDFIHSGQTLRLINVNGVVEAPVKLQIGEWQHVAATCSANGALRLFLNGKLVGEVHVKPVEHQTTLSANADLKRFGTFVKLLRAKGLSGTYACRHAEMVLDMITSLHRHQQIGMTSPRIAKIPPANGDAVNELYASTIDRMATGLVNALSKNKSSDSSTKRIRFLAIQAGIINR